MVYTDHKRCQTPNTILLGGITHMAPSTARLLVACTPGFATNAHTLTLLHTAPLCESAFCCLTTGCSSPDAQARAEQLHGKLQPCQNRSTSSSV
jgi:hypothetical protein